MLRMCLIGLFFIVTLLWGIKRGAEKIQSNLNRSIPLVGLQEKRNMLSFVENLVNKKSTSLPDNNQLLINGIPSRIDSYTSSQSLKNEINRVEQRYKLRGLKTEIMDLGKIVSMNVHDSKKKEFESVLFFEDDLSGKTVVVPINYMNYTKMYNVNLKAPCYPKSKSVLNVVSDQNGTYSENLLLSCNAPMINVVSYYNEKLINEGWKAEKTVKETLKKNDVDNAICDLYTKGNQELWVTGSNDIKNGVTDSSFVFLVYNDKK
jgi:hypothetical protein